MNRLKRAIGVGALILATLSSPNLANIVRAEEAKQPTTLAEQCKNYKSHRPKPEALEHFKKAHACSDEKNLDCAISEYQRAISIDPKYDEAMNDLGVIFYNNDSLDSALNLFKEALELNSCNPLIYNNAGNTYLNIGKKHGDKKYFYSAINMFEKCLELNPESDLKDKVKHKIEVIKDKYL